MKTHRNAPEAVELPFVFDSAPTDENSDLAPADPIVPPANTKVCHLCDDSFPTAIQLESHLFTHILAEKSRKLSNSMPLSSADDSNEVLLAEQLNSRDIDSSSLDDFEGFDGSTSEFVESSAMKSETQAEEADDHRVDTTQDDCAQLDVVEIMSDSDEDDIETIRYQLHHNVAPINGIVDLGMDNDHQPDEPLYISSDDEADITEVFHCFYCNGRFQTLKDFGEHEKCCFYKPEPDF